MNRLRESLTAGYALFDRTLPRFGRFSSRWSVQVSLPEDEIVSWRFS
ncbi:MAG: hypothetical protein NUW23_03025 [Firmicutes bacterium]|nr:hypothetical protein [Bacillota bacterium]